MVHHFNIPDKEICRLQKMLLHEEKAYKNGFKIVAGVDEAGRGPLAGPLVAAACVLPSGLFIPGINDSKKLSSKKRSEIFQCLVSNSQIQYGIGIITPEEIDQINIYQATIKAMWKAVAELTDQPDCLLVDGMQLFHPIISLIKIIKGDQLSQSIAAASIIAKETRDHLMIQLHEKWPVYGFSDNKGYGTQRHFAALQRFGPSPSHRFTFEPIKSQWKRENLC